MNEIIGTEQTDALVGTTLQDKILGLGGNDRIQAAGTVTMSCMATLATI